MNGAGRGLLRTAMEFWEDASIVGAAKLGNKKNRGWPCLLDTFPPGWLSMARQSFDACKSLSNSKSTSAFCKKPLDESGLKMVPRQS